MLKKLFFILIFLIIILAVAGFLYTRLPKFGREPSPARLARIQASPNYKNGKFVCLEPIEKVVERDEGMLAGWIRFLTTSVPNLKPSGPLPTEKVDLKLLNPQQNLIVWLGHSSYYMQLAGKRILIDPVMSGYGAPVPFANRAFAGTDVYKTSDIPDIDVLVISHEHWDHLDYDTIMNLKARIKTVVCPLGVGEYFEQWGFAPEQIKEEDWNTKIVLAPDLSIYVLPAQHYTNRLFKQNQTLWAGFAFITPTSKVFYSGDSGYGKHFKAIGEQFGGFDVALLEDGQYNKDWHRIHMYPEEVAQAAMDLKAKVVMPCHNGKFAIAMHAWDEPLKRLAAASVGKPYELLTPEIGALVLIPPHSKTENWWEKVK
jgi:L-ascorbate metabolism protein UlaG (beta-lactamase superfamily)